MDEKTLIEKISEGAQKFNEISQPITSPLEFTNLHENGNIKDFDNYIENGVNAIRAYYGIFYYYIEKNHFTKKELFCLNEFYDFLEKRDSERLNEFLKYYDLRKKIKVYKPKNFTVLKN